MSNNGKDPKKKTQSSIIDNAINGQKVIGEVSQYLSRCYMCEASTTAFLFLGIRPIEFSPSAQIHMFKILFYEQIRNVALQPVIVKMTF